MNLVCRAGAGAGTGAGGWGRGGRFEIKAITDDPTVSLQCFSNSPKSTENIF